MFARKLSLLISILVLTGLGSVSAQQPAPPKIESPAKIGLISPKPRRTPQVVTVIHRISGLQMFRLLMRSEQQVNAISNLDPTINLMEEVQTNVTAGLALEDGETIAAWLPEADLEFGDFGWTETPQSPEELKAEREARRPPGLFNRSLFSKPDISVIGADGLPLPAKYIGVDGVTGLSILKLAHKNGRIIQPIPRLQLSIGQNVSLLGPEQAGGVTAERREVYVRVGVTPAEVRLVMRGPSGTVSRLRVSSAKLSQANIGGVVVNEDGSTVGIVDSVDGGEASILPTNLIRLAANRVLEEQMSVPRPWLGVRGEAMNNSNLVTHGWKLQRAQTLVSEHKGIVLTSIAPGSPAEAAALRAGDVILKINDRLIANPNELNWFFEQMGPQKKLSFTLARPESTVEESISVELKAAGAVRLSGSRARNSLANQGIETIELRPQLATQMGAGNAGLLVVFVDPTTSAFAAGLQPGDLIETINGKPATAALPLPPATNGQITLTIVRQMQRLELVLESATRKN